VCRMRVCYRTAIGNDLINFQAFHLIVVAKRIII
jgi:hypothetical protein